jgi:hypothetical protein
MLEMLQAKTKGNLSEQENEALQNWLTNLRLNYVDEVKTEEEGEKAESEPAESAAKEEKEDKDVQEAPEEKVAEDKNK